MKPHEGKPHVVNGGIIEKFSLPGPKARKVPGNGVLIHSRTFPPLTARGSPTSGSSIPVCHSNPSGTSSKGRRRIWSFNNSLFLMRSTERACSAKRRPSPSPRETTRSFPSSPLLPIHGAVPVPRPCSSVPQNRQIRQASPCRPSVRKIHAKHSSHAGKSKRHLPERRKGPMPPVWISSATQLRWPPHVNRFRKQRKTENPSSARNRSLRLKQSARRKMGEQSTINIERNLEFDRHTAEDSESTGFTRTEVIIIRHDELLVKQVSRRTWRDTLSVAW